jgi:hypothetical protein
VLVEILQMLLGGSGPLGEITSAITRKIDEIPAVEIATSLTEAVADRIRGELDPCDPADGG